MADNLMTVQEQEEFETLAKARRSGRTLAFYGGQTPDLDGAVPNLPGYRTSGQSEPGASLNYELDGVPRQIIGHSKRLRVGFADTVGRRPAMEDEIIIAGQLRDVNEDYFAVFDGHSGRDSSEYASQTVHKLLINKLNEGKPPTLSLHEAFVTTSEQIRDKNIGGGSTAIAALFCGNKLYIANAGDSRAVLSDGDAAIRCSRDHKPEDPSEEERIISAGGRVTKVTNKQGKTIGRVNGMLAVSRAIGDSMFYPYVTAEPEIKEFTINSAKNKVLILACDGLWDVITDDEAVTIALSEPSPVQAAVKLRDTAYNKGSGDNISVIVVFIPTSFSQDFPVPNTNMKILFSVAGAVALAAAAHVVSGHIYKQ